VLGLVAANPGMFPQYDDEHRFVMLRQFPYRIVYQVQPDQLDVVAVAHSSRSPGYWQGRT
jgi:mRNA-degrading endonuclease RelE of RelBE toxin-antitoxin system